jgi:hypothetical protein
VQIADSQQIERRYCELRLQPAPNLDTLFIAAKKRCKISVGALTWRTVIFPPAPHTTVVNVQDDAI